MSGGEFEGTERFEIKRRLGAGGMGVVYEAYDRERSARVALKTLRRVDAQALFRFKNEFRALQDLEHPNLISLGELIQDGGEWFFTMELLDGVSFLSYVRPKLEAQALSDTAVAPSVDALRAERVAAAASPEPPEYDEAKLRAALKQLAGGIAVLHRADKVHRDIKPSNVLVTPEGRVVLLDFGLVTHAEPERQSSQANIVGTAEYMAPEQAAAGEVGPAADWYSVGVMLYEALTGQLPHGGKTALDILMKKQQQTPPPPRQWSPGVPEDLDELCVDLLRLAPEERPQSNAILRRLGVAADSMPSDLGARGSSSSGQTMPFVGRAEELSVLARAFETSRDHPVMVVVHGESGVGKSELVRRFTKSLDKDVVVLAGRCYEREAVSYKAIDGIADALSAYMRRLPDKDATALLPLRAGLLPRLFPILQRVEAIATAPKEAQILDVQELRRRMLEALRELLVRLTKRHPVVLVIDDLQWTDADSLTLLEEVLAHFEAPPLLLLTTMRPVDEKEHERILAAASGLDHVQEIQLQELAPQEARDLAKLLLPKSDPERLEQIADETRGHPLFLQELVRHIDETSDPALVKLEDALRARISRLDKETRRLLELLSIAGAPITQQVATSAAKMEHRAFSKAAAVLRVANLARSHGAHPTDLIESYHDRIREAAVAQLDQAGRTYCHQRLATALEQFGAAKTDPQALVRHAEAAGELARAAEFAELAAQNAVDAMAFDRAVGFFQTALRLGAYGEDKTRALRIALAHAFGNAGRGPDAAEAFMAAANGADSPTRLDCQREAARQLLATGYMDRGIDIVQSLLVEIGESFPSTPRRVLLSLLWHRFRLRVRGLRWTERHETEVDGRTLARVDLLKAAAYGLGMVDPVRAADFNVRYLLLALRVGEAHRVANALGIEATFLASQQSKRAQKLLEKTRSIVARRPKDTYLAVSLPAAEAVVTYFEGRFRDAEALFDSIEHQWLYNTTGATVELNLTRVLRCICLFQLGSIARLAQVFPPYLRDALRRGDRFLETGLRGSVGTFLLLARDEPDGARRNLQLADWTPPERGFHLQHLQKLMGQVSLALYEGRSLEALEELSQSFAALARSLLLRTPMLGASWYPLRARLLLSAFAASNSRKELGEVRRITRQLERMPLGHAAVEALILRAALAIQAGDENPDRAILHLQSAIQTAEHHGFSLRVAVARRRLGELLGGDEGASHIAQADAWMTKEGMVNIDRWMETMAPGFARTR